MAVAAGSALHARFLGNAAVEITDGTFTLLTDFPYQSGAFGYMTYDPALVAPRPHSACLFTHAHADHFEPDLVGRIGCSVVGPASVESRARGVKVIPLAAKIRLAPLTITPVRTSHGSEEHDSYLVEWNGLRLYFTGDTDDLAELRGQRRLDALFITPWLLARARAAGALPAAKKVVIYHHRDGERVDGCEACIVPRQGQMVEIPAR
ncbi:MAG: MBL fold metallo-hydrolase [Thermoanaerobaculia bacterium]